MFTEDLSVFTSSADFGTPATWSVDSAVPRNGIFDAQAGEALAGLVDATKPVFRFVMADMPTAARGQTLTIAGTVYEIVRVFPNFGSPGFALAQLEES
jgi:hypothetical protein